MNEKSREEEPTKRGKRESLRERRGDSEKEREREREMGGYLLDAERRE